VRETTGPGRSAKRSPLLSRSLPVSTTLLACRKGLCNSNMLNLKRYTGQVVKVCPSWASAALNLFGLYDDACQIGSPTSRSLLVTVQPRHIASHPFARSSRECRNNDGSPWPNEPLLYPYCIVSIHSLGLVRGLDLCTNCIYDLEHQMAVTPHFI
jgi:hypothetical protein